jgi:hypothetical protein
MRDPIEQYLEDVLCWADLAKDDERSVGTELKEHLVSLTKKALGSNPKETYAMLKVEFGQPSKVGRGIAAAKGRLRTFLKKQRRRLPWHVGIGVFLAIVLRYTVVEAFYVAGDGVTPMIPKGSRCLVYKLAHSFVPGDVLVYRNSSGLNLLGKVIREGNSGDWIVERNIGTERTMTEVASNQIVGRVFLNTR